MTERVAYMNHAATGVLPRYTHEACATFLKAQSEGGVLGTWPYELKIPAFRECLGKLIGAPGKDVALLRNTSEAANVLALGIDWRPGDEVVLPDDEFPANAVPWLALRSRGVTLRFIRTAQERMTPDVLRRTMTDRTRVVTLSWVSFADGYRHDLASLAQVAHERGALLCVDGIQGLGAFPVDVSAAGVDAFYGGGQKWMLALQGIAYLYVAPSLQERLRVGAPGWRALADMWDFLNYDQPWVADASRFEGGTPNLIGVLSLASSVEFLLRYDRNAIARHVLALTDRLCEGLSRGGATVLSRRGEGISSGIVTFTLPGTDPIELGKRLQREGIVTTYRANGIRVSPHGYNAFDEIDALCAVASNRPL